MPFEREKEKMLYNYETQTIVNKTLTELPDGLIDCHVVGDHVIIDQKLELVTNAISLIHQNGGLQQQKKQDEITYADDALTRIEARPDLQDCRPRHLRCYRRRYRPGPCPVCGHSRGSPNTFRWPVPERVDRF